MWDPLETLRHPWHLVVPANYKQEDGRILRAVYCGWYCTKNVEAFPIAHCTSCNVDLLAWRIITYLHHVRQQTIWMDHMVTRANDPQIVTSQGLVDMPQQLDPSHASTSIFKSLCRLHLDRQWPSPWPKPRVLGLEEAKLECNDLNQIVIIFQVHLNCAHPSPWKQTFSSLLYLKSKLWNHLTVHLSLVRMFATKRTFPYPKTNCKS